MTKTLLILALTLFPAAALAQYQPLEPLPIPGLSGSPSFPALMAAVFRLAMLAGAVLAVLMITYGGIQYMTSDVLGTKEAGRSRIKNAVLGFLLLLAIWLILYTINPNLLNFNLNSITQIGNPNARNTLPTLGGSGNNTTPPATVPPATTQPGGPCAVVGGNLPTSCIDSTWRPLPSVGTNGILNFTPGTMPSSEIVSFRNACTSAGGSWSSAPIANGGTRFTCHQKI